MPPTISLCMIVRDEEKLLKQCLKSVKSIVDEIIIVDTGSKDRTVEIAREFGARIIKYKWDGNFGRARNICIKNAAGLWILALDADEKIAKKDLPKLKGLIKNTKIAGYILPIRNYTKTHDLLRNWRPVDGRYPVEEKFSGCPGWSITKRIRLFQKKEGVCYKEGRSAHIDSLNLQGKGKCKVEECDIVIHHFQNVKGKIFIAKKQKEYLRNALNYIKDFPDNPWIYLNVGITLFALEQDDRATAYLNRAIRLNPKFDMAYFVLGMLYKEKARYWKAVSNLKKAIEINPRHADAWTVLGIVYDGQDRLSDAEKALNRAIRINPDHPLAHNSLGVVYQKEGEFNNAEVEYKKAIDIYPGHPYARRNLKRLLKQKRKSI